MSTWEVVPRGPVRGEVWVPGDKSISHRSLLLNALADGPARVRGLLRGEDVMSTLAAVRALGVRVDDDGEELVVHGTGALTEPGRVLDCGNSGTTMRLLTGILAAEPIFTVLTGDDSLRGRPMKRVVDPLRAMGARIDGRLDGDRAPLAIRGGTLEVNRQKLSVASAQVKTALLLAGRREGMSVWEPAQSRDHTERMLSGMGATIDKNEEGWLWLRPTPRLDPLDVDVPGDMSSAAFWMVVASIVPGSELVIHGVGMNPTRSGALDVLLKMGADITIEPVDAPGAEPVATLTVRHTTLKGTRIHGELALRALDELPVLSVAAAFAQGETTIADAEELRVKESDRISRVVQGLRGLHVDVDEHPDGMLIRGGQPFGPAAVDASGDHRIAMAFAVAGCAARHGVQIAGAESVGTSYPSFPADLEVLRG